MTEWLDELERALSLHLRGRSAEAVAIGKTLLTRLKGTPQAARIHRHQSEFLHAVGDYAGSRQMAREAGILARASRHAGEILAASLMELTCDLYEGQVAVVHQQLGDLIELAPGQPTPLAFMATLALTVGNFDEVHERAEQARALVDEHAPAGLHPDLDLFRANLLILRVRALLAEDKPGEAAALCERIAEFQSDSPVPRALTLALRGLGLVRSRQPERGRRCVEESVALGRGISHELHGQCLTLSGAAMLELQETERAIEQLQSACGLLTHALERQEALLLLGRLYRASGREEEAVESFRRATEPSIDTLFGRMAVQGLHELQGLRAL